MGALALEIFMFLVIVFLVLALICLIQIGWGIEENFSNRNRNWTIGIMTITLGLICVKPGGIINFNKSEGEDLFIAQREGTANCATTFKLKQNNKFVERKVCFGVNEIRGNYEIKNDTIFFLEVSVPRGEEDYYEFGILKKSKLKDEKTLFRYRNRSDTLGHELWIIKNDILK